MLLLAIDLYGIHPFKQPTRIALKPNLNIVTGANGAGKTAICHTLSALLLNGSPQKMTFIENHPAQAAVILQVRDGGVYRIAADFLKGILNLSKLDPAGKGTLIEKDREKIRTWIQKELNGLADEEVSSLFMIDRSRLPSTLSLLNGNLQRSSSAAAAVAAALPSNRSNGLSISSEGRADKEKKLKESQKRLEEISQFEQESLTIRDKASEIKYRLEEIQALDLKINHFQEVEAKKFSTLAGIEKVPAEELKRYEEGVQNKQNELTQMEEEGFELESEISQVGGVDPFKDRQIQIGIGLTALSFLLPFFIVLRGPLRHLFLAGMLAGIGLAARAYLQLNSRASSKSGLEKRRAGLNEKARQLDKKFEKEHKEAIELIKKTGSKDIEGLKALQRTYQNHLRNAQETIARRQTLLKEETVENLEARRQELEKKAEALEDKLRENEGLTQEIYRLQDEVRNSSDVAEPSIDLGQSLPAFSLAPENLSAGSEKSSALPFFSQALAIGRARGLPLPLDQIQKQAEILSSLFSPDKKSAIHLDELGEMKLGQVGIDRLSSGTADRIFLCVALSTWDRFAQVSFPLVLDDPLVNLDPKHQEIALELLRGVSKKRQVVLLSFSPFPAKNGDHRVQL